MDFAGLLSVFINVVTPVFTLVLTGYLLGSRLNLEARTLSRTAFYIFVPAFVFNVVSQLDIDLSIVFRMALFAIVVHVACVGLAFGVARLLRRSAEMTAAYVGIAAFGNVGNFGLSLVEFRFGPESLPIATLYFLVITIVGFSLSVIAASAVRGGGMGAALGIFKTPGIMAIIPAAFFLATPLEVPLFLDRITGLLGQAMIPTMLVTLGVQLAEVERPRISLDVIIASVIRLAGAPLLAVVLVVPFGLEGLERSVGILQASMPVAILVSIVAIEYKIVPDFVTTTVLFSTVASFVTLTILLSIV